MAKMSFPLFTLFPAEVQGLVMEQCPPNDRVCLSLTCKSLYNLSTLSKPIDLETTDMGHGPLCCSHTDSDWTSRWQHRRDLLYSSNEVAFEVERVDAKGPGLLWRVWEVHEEEERTPGNMSSWQTQRADLEAKFLDAYIAWRSIWEEGLEEVV
ncbi:uncharacterized protein L3040_002043 [Drepanopeziza brunnea f. sp. 'multigermtubi']|uniref:uncharacterized protein n=1 Tax=Drepanopeziza brunnea f. sp. 'multigermtubi' TaxID=698441 RepID=UPI0023855025|nr:hypothetical protein L3040_002043 [Drepanopeziza brunnea f. sp. 'multigermtubi']